MPAAERASYQILPAPHQSLNGTSMTTSSDSSLVNGQYYTTSAPTIMHHHHNHHHHAHPTITTYHPIVHTSKAVHHNRGNMTGHIPHRITSSTQHHVHSTVQNTRGKGQQKPIRPPIRSVSDHDVLCGRGVNIAHHPGNERFRTLVTGRHDNMYCTTYSANEKRAVAEEIIRHIKALQPPGRFLKRDGRGQVSRGLHGPWEELTDKEAVKKTCQALRDCNRIDREGYAAGVAAPQDVMMSMKQRAMTGMSGKQQAAAAAAASAAAASSVSLKRSRAEVLPPPPVSMPKHYAHNPVRNTPGVVDDTSPHLAPVVVASAQPLANMTKHYTHNPSCNTPGVRDNTSPLLSQEAIENIPKQYSNTSPLLSEEAIENIPDQYNPVLNTHGVVDDCSSRLSPIAAENIPKHYLHNPSRNTQGLGDPIDVNPGTEWSKKQRITECDTFSHQLPPPDGILVAPTPLPTVVDQGLPQNVIYDSTHQEFHKVWTQTQSSPIPMSNECLSVAAVISKEVMSDDFSPHELSTSNSTSQQLSTNINHSNDRRLISEVSPQQQLNTDTGDHLPSNSQSNHDQQLSSDAAHHSEVPPNVCHPEICHHQDFSIDQSQQLNHDTSHNNHMNPKISHSQQLNHLEINHGSQLSSEINRNQQMDQKIDRGQQLNSDIGHSQHTSMSNNPQSIQKMGDSHQLNSEINHHFDSEISQQFISEINPDISQQQLSPEISRQLNVQIGGSHQMNTDIIHRQHLSINHHHDGLDIVNAPQMVGSAKFQSNSIPEFHQLSVVDSDMLLSQGPVIQPTPIAALTHPDVPLSKHPLVADEGDLDNSVLDSIPHNLDQASKLIMNTPISSAREDALQNVNAVEICPTSVQLSSDFFQ